MEAYLYDWLNLLLRWLHVITGIAWIGASFYFVWLDNSLEEPKDPALKEKGVAGELWAVHGGGFYNPQKYMNAPAALPPNLHWFKWEAYWTWISGFALLVVQYYFNADVYLIDKSVANIAPMVAVLIGLVVLFFGWVVYDLLCRSPWGSNGALMLAIGGLLITGVAYGLSQVFSGRGAYIHVGAMLGTIMAANVFMVIIPGQRKTVASMVAGQVPDPADGLRAKQRSVHNNYITLPVLFIMISNHYPMTFGSKHSWLVLIGMIAAGVLIRQFFNLRHKGKIDYRWPLAGVAVIVVLIMWMAPKPRVDDGAPRVSFAAVRQVIDNRCVSCHAARPTQAGFNEAPKGVMLDSADKIRAQAAQIVQQTVVSKAMPIGNLTQITEEERALLDRWYAQGAKTD